MTVYYYMVAEGDSDIVCGLFAWPSFERSVSEQCFVFEHNESGSATVADYIFRIAATFVKIYAAVRDGSSAFVEALLSVSLGVRSNGAALLFFLAGNSQRTMEAGRKSAA